MPTSPPEDSKSRISRRLIGLSAVMLLLVGAVWMTRGAGKPLELYAQTRTSLNTPSGGFALVEFALNQNCRIKSIRVWETVNQETSGDPIWHLVGDPRSDPLANLTYGATIPTMRTSDALADAPRVRLRPDTTYRVAVDVAGRGEVDAVFTTGPATNR